MTSLPRETLMQAPTRELSSTLTLPTFRQSKSKTSNRSPLPRFAANGDYASRYSSKRKKISATYTRSLAKPSDLICRARSFHRFPAKNQYRSTNPSNAVTPLSNSVASAMRRTLITTCKPTFISFATLCLNEPVQAWKTVRRIPSKHPGMLLVFKFL